MPSTEKTMTSENPDIQNAEIEEPMSAEDYRQAAKALARDGRWQDLAELLIERAESATSAGARSQHLVAAAQVFERNLADRDRAYITLMAAFEDDPTNQEAVSELARVAVALGRFADSCRNAWPWPRR